MSRRSKLRKVLLQHPDVVQAYVVGVPDQAKGEIVGAAVELRAGAITDTASIIALCRERLASYKVPIQLAFRTAQLPVSSTLSGHSASVEIETPTSYGRRARWTVAGRTARRFTLRRAETWTGNNYLCLDELKTHGVLCVPPSWTLAASFSIRITTVFRMKKDSV